MSEGFGRAVGWMILGLLSALIGYGIVAFIAWDADISNWPEGARAVTALLTVIIGALLVRYGE